MSTNQRIADALTRVRNVVDERGAEIVRTKELERRDRELLIANGWLQEVTRGWYFLSRPDVAPGDSGPWYSHYWDFLRLYLPQRFGKEYCLSPESSLGLHTGDTLIPDQIVVIVGKGAGNPVTLPFDTSLLAYAGRLPEEYDEVRGLQVMTLPMMLCRLAPSVFERESEEVQLALAMVDDPSELARILLAENAERAAGRLIAAYRAMGDSERAERLQGDLQASGMRVLKPKKPVTPVKLSYGVSPYAARIEASWRRMREQVLTHFPQAPGTPKNIEGYLAGVEKLYQTDAYHSLSIEGYRVSPELIERVRNHEWNPDRDDGDRESQQALAARGYYEAFQRVEESVRNVLAEENPGEVAARDLREWYRALWSPHVNVGLLESHDVVGYRRGPVFIRGSRHTPPPREALPDAMDMLFSCLKREEHAGVRAVLGHYFFVFIHPYPDGNGRIGRFLMNVMLASGGYPWKIVHVEHRREYFAALENTHLSGDISSFAEFLARA